MICWRTAWPMYSLSVKSDIVLAPVCVDNVVFCLNSLSATLRYILDLWYFDAASWYLRCWVSKCKKEVNFRIVTCFHIPIFCYKVENLIYKSWRFYLWWWWILEKRQWWSTWWKNCISYLWNQTLFLSSIFPFNTFSHHRYAGQPIPKGYLKSVSPLYIWQGIS